MCLILYNFLNFLKFSENNEFSSPSSDKGIIDKVYQHVVKVWNKFEMKIMKNHHVLHLYDVLSDIFEKFRDSCPLHFYLLPSHYLVAPALSCDPTLSITKVELDLILGADMYLLLKQV